MKNADVYSNTAYVVAAGGLLVAAGAAHGSVLAASVGFALLVVMGLASWAFHLEDEAWSVGFYDGRGFALAAKRHKLARTLDAAAMYALGVGLLLSNVPILLPALEGIPVLLAFGITGGSLVAGYALRVRFRPNMITEYKLAVLYAAGLLVSALAGAGLELLVAGLLAFAYAYSVRERSHALWHVATALALFLWYTAVALGG